MYFEIKIVLFDHLLPSHMFELRLDLLISLTVVISTTFFRRVGSNRSELSRARLFVTRQFRNIH